MRRSSLSRSPPEDLPTRRELGREENPPSAEKRRGEGEEEEELDDMFASDSEGRTPRDARSVAPGDAGHDRRLECDDDGYYVSYIGEIIGNRYKVSSNSTGKGMFSSVVKCVDMETQNEVAIKIIRINDMMRSTGEREYSFVKRFRGAPNIVQAQGAFLHQNHLCIVFEWLQGSLKSCIHSTTRHDVRRVQDLARQIFEGLRLIHEKGLVHADLKPENILVDSARSAIRISDFGSMHHVSDASPARYLVSRFYRAPEIILGCLSYGQPVDVWSAGCILYECFTGDVMFSGRTNNDMIKLIMEYRGNFPKRLLNKGVFTKTHFSECLTQLRWTNPQGMTQVIRSRAPSRSVYGSLVDSARPSGRLYSETEQTLIRRLSNLIERCLTIDPKKRISAGEALEHPFLRPK